jgi:hypothetical protein
LGDAFVQLISNVSPDQQGDEGANLGMVELCCHPVEAGIYGQGVESLIEFRVDFVNDFLQVRVELGWSLPGIKHGGTCHALNIDPAPETPEHRQTLFSAAGRATVTSL